MRHGLFDSRELLLRLLAVSISLSPSLAARTACIMLPTFCLDRLLPADRVEPPLPRCPLAASSGPAGIAAVGWLPFISYSACAYAVQVRGALSRYTFKVVVQVEGRGSNAWRCCRVEHVVRLTCSVVVCKAACGRGVDVGSPVVTTVVPSLVHAQAAEGDGQREEETL